MLTEHGLTAHDAGARRYDWTLVSADIAGLAFMGLAVAPDARRLPLDR